MPNFDGTGSRGTGRLGKGLGPCSKKKNWDQSNIIGEKISEESNNVSSGQGKGFMRKKRQR